MNSPKSLRSPEEIAEKVIDYWFHCYQGTDLGYSLKILNQHFSDAIRQERKAALEEASAELEKAFEECKTYNLLHGAARVRALFNPGRKSNEKS